MWRPRRPNTGVPHCPCPRQRRSSLRGRSGTKVIKNTASPSVDATVLLAFCHREDAAHQALHPMKWQEINPKSDISLSVKYQQSHLPPPIRTVWHRSFRVTHEAWTILTDASKKGSEIKFEPASLKIKCGKRLSLTDSPLHSRAPTVDTDFCTEMPKTRACKWINDATIPYLELCILTMQPMTNVCVSSIN